LSQNEVKFKHAGAATIGSTGALGGSRVGSGAATIGNTGAEVGSGVGGTGASWDAVR